jgi:hypothetical protein
MIDLIARFCLWRWKENSKTKKKEITPTTIQPQRDERNNNESTDSVKKNANSAIAYRTGGHRTRRVDSRTGQRSTPSNMRTNSHRADWTQPEPGGAIR